MQLFTAKSAKQRHIILMISLFLSILILLPSCAVYVRTEKSYILLPRKSARTKQLKKSKISSDRLNPKKSDLEKVFTPKSLLEGDRNLLLPIGTNSTGSKI